MESVQTEDQFEAAFAEISASKGTSAPAPAPEPTKDPSAAQPAPAPAPAADPPADAPAPSPAPEVTLEGLQKQIAELQHRERSSANRVSVFMRENNQLREQLAEVRRLQEQRAATAAPAPATADPDEPDALAEAPELSKAVERRIQKATAALQSRLEAAQAKLEELGVTTTSVQQTLQPIVDKTKEQQYQETFNALDQQFTAAWRDTVKAPEFADWLQSQPKQVRDLYETGATATEAGTVLKLFYAEKGAPRTEATPPSPPAPSGQQDRLRLAAGIPSRGNARTPPAGPAKDDFDGAFEHFVSQKRAG